VAEQVDPGDARELDVRDNDIEQLFLYSVDCLYAAFARANRVSLSLEGILHHHAKLGIIVDDEDPILWLWQDPSSYPVVGLRVILWPGIDPDRITCCATDAMRGKSHYSRFWSGCQSRVLAVSPILARSGSARCV
jgi:hypothetical protein